MDRLISDFFIDVFVDKWHILTECNIGTDSLRQEIPYVENGYLVKSCLQDYNTRFTRVLGIADWD